MIEGLGSKFFCSVPCLEKFKSANFVKCMDTDCEKTFMKSLHGIIKGSLWYCSEICADKH